MKLTQKMGWILAASALLALEASAQSSTSSKLARPSFGLTPGGKSVGGSLEGDVVHVGSIVSFAIPLGKPSFMAGKGSAAPLMAAARDVAALTGVRIDLPALAAAAVRFADRGLDEVGASLALRIAAPAHGLIEIDVRKRANGFDVTVTVVSGLGKPLGGFTPGGTSLAAQAKPTVSDRR